MKHASSATVLALAAFLPAALATQPKPPRIIITSNYADPSAPVLQIRNNEQCRIKFTIQPGPLSSVPFTAATLTIEGNNTAFATLTGVTLNPGRQVVHVLGIADSPCTSPTPVFLHEPLDVSKAGVNRKSFEDAFLGLRVPVTGPSENAITDFGQGYIDSSPINPSAFAARPLPPGTPVVDANAFDLKTLLSLKPGTLPITQPVPTGKSVATERNIVRSLSGQWSLQSAPGRFESGAGYLVRVWQNAGEWRLLGAGWVGTGGYWNISINSTAVLDGRPFHLEYLAWNRFVRLQDPSGNAYSWVHASDVTSEFGNVGSWFGDLTVNGDLPGLANLMDGSLRLWNKFTSVHISALRDQPIRVTYPNTLASGGCIYDDGAGPYAWSCSYSSDGRIYFIAGHAGNRTTIEHELAHSIHSFFWGGRRAAGDGGSHALNGCYNPGLALTEGFANFLAHWTEFSETETFPVLPGLGYNIESPSSVCPGPTNEVWVSANLWDLYDNVWDANARGEDRFTFAPGKTVISILQWQQDSMVDYLPLMSDTGTRPAITSVFRLNGMIP